MVELLDTDLRWIVTIMPRDVRDLVKASGGRIIVAGGFIRSVISHEKIADIDLFADDAEYLRAIVYGLEKTRKEAGYSSRTLRTKNAVTLATGERLPVQGITRWLFSSPETCIQSFDYTIAAAAVWFDQPAHQWRSICHPRFYADLAGKRLHYTSPVREEEAGGSMLRAVKFLRQGYTIDLQSLGRVMARVNSKIRLGDRGEMAIDEGTLIASILREVDPLTIVDGLPIETEEDQEST